MQHEPTAIHGDISGTLSVTLANGQSLDDFCMQHIAEYNRDRFEAMAIRVFIGKETVITIYALDKHRQEGTTFNHDKIPVKKFKLDMPDLSTLFSYCDSLNFTLSTGSYQIDDMEVINK
ncbi:MAG: hypothetical protein ABI921_05840 [Panacibacter sp.]